MTDPEDVPEEIEAIKRRLSAVEGRVDREAALRAMMDNDLSQINAKLDAHGGLLQALHVTQSDHTRRLTTLETKVDALETKVDEGFARTDAGFAKVLVGMTEIVRRLDERDGQDTS